MSKKRIKKYIDIRPIKGGKLTGAWEVFSRNERFGEIRWYGGWRKYCFFYECLDVEGWMDSDCLKYLGEFCEERTREQLQDAKERKKYGTEN